MLIRRLRYFARTRGVLSLALLLALAASSAEAVLGDMRDGETHHESTVVALEHRELQGAEHQHVAESGSEKGSGTETPAHSGEQHHHPGGSDHCSHLHGVGIPPSFSLAFAASTTEVHSVVHSRAASFTPPAQPQPPRA